MAAFLLKSQSDCRGPDTQILTTTTPSSRANIVVECADRRITQNIQVHDRRACRSSRQRCKFFSRDVEACHACKALPCACYAMLAALIAILISFLTRASVVTRSKYRPEHEDMTSIAWWAHRLCKHAGRSALSEQGRARDAHHCDECSSVRWMVCVRRWRMNVGPCREGPEERRYHSNASIVLKGLILLLSLDRNNFTVLILVTNPIRACHSVCPGSAKSLPLW